MTQVVSVPRLVNVIDVEATCWDRNEVHAGMNEIIEIGVTVVDLDTRRILSTDSILVKPANSTVSTFCTQLTTLTQEQVDTGITFEQAAELLSTKYDSAHRLFASYGKYDDNIFIKEFARRDMTNVFAGEDGQYAHCNIKSLFAKVYHLRRPVGMAAALHHVDIRLRGTHHRGGDDSLNIATILLTVLIRRDEPEAQQLLQSYYVL